LNPIVRPISYGDLAQTLQLQAPADDWAQGKRVLGEAKLYHKTPLAIIAL